MSACGLHWPGPHGGHAGARRGRVGSLLIDPKGFGAWPVYINIYIYIDIEREREKDINI